MPASKIATTALMFIGASPSGTGGGIKTTTAVMLLFLVATIVTGKKDTVVMKRRMSKDVMMRAITIATIAFVFVGFITMLLCIVEQSHLAASGSFVRDGLGLRDGRAFHRNYARAFPHEPDTDYHYDVCGQSGRVYRIYGSGQTHEQTGRKQYTLSRRAGNDRIMTGE